MSFVKLKDSIYRHENEHFWKTYDALVTTVSITFYHFHSELITLFYQEKRSMQKDTSQVPPAHPPESGPVCSWIFSFLGHRGRVLVPTLNLPLVCATHIIAPLRLRTAILPSLFQHQTPPRFWIIPSAYSMARFLHPKILRCLSTLLPPLPTTSFLSQQWSLQRSLESRPPPAATHANQAFSSATQEHGFVK